MPLSRRILNRRKLKLKLLRRKVTRRVGKKPKLVVKKARLVVKPQTQTQPTQQKKVAHYDNSKVALLIGCEYVAYAKKKLDERLPGCHRDIVEACKLLKTHYKVNPHNMTVLADGGKYAAHVGGSPSLKNIKRHLEYLVKKSKLSQVKHLIVYYSGHGLQVRDQSGDEPDRKDEAIVPTDYRSSGFMTDDYIRENFWNKVDESTKQITAIFDCCNSGSVLDLPYQYTAPNKMIRVNRVGESKTPLVISLSGCKDPQTSASAYNMERRRKWQGAMSWCLRSTLAQKRYLPQPLNQLIDTVRKMLRSRGFKQVPQLAFSQDLDPQSVISLF